MSDPTPSHPDHDAVMLMIHTRGGNRIERGIAGLLAAAYWAVAQYSTLGVGITHGTAARHLIRTYAAVCLLIAIKPRSWIHQIAAPLAAIVIGGRLLEFTRIVANGRQDILGTVGTQTVLLVLVVAFHAAGSAARRQ